MKNLLTLFLLMGMSTIVLAQNPRIERLGDDRLETYSFSKGVGDSVQYTLRHRADTLQTTLYYRSGKIKTIEWRDSVYSFDVKGRLRLRQMGLKTPKKDQRTNNAKEYEKTIAYYPNGQCQSLVSYKNGQYFEQRFNENGQVTYTKLESNTPSVCWERVSFSRGKTRFSSKIDTSIQNNELVRHFYDTIFYNNGHVYSISLQRQMDGARVELLSKKYYNLNGALIASELPDSVRLISFKDNVDCYYGLKNRQDDTLFKAQFDRIEMEDNLIKAFLGNRCTPLYLDGSVMAVPTKNLSDIDELYAQLDLNPFQIDSYASVNNDDELDDFLARKLNKFFRFETTDRRFGIMTQDGTLVIPPQYLRPWYYIINVDGFSFSENKGNHVVKIGVMNRKGKPLFKDTFKYVNYTGFEDYFIVSPEFEKSNRNVKTYRPTLAGLGKGSNETVLIEPQFENINWFKKNSLFLVTQKNPNNKNSFSDPIYGLYDPRTRKWLLDAKDYTIENTYSEEKHSYFVLKNVKTQKYCLIDTTGKYLIKPSTPVDFIGIIDDENGSFWVKKKGKYYFLDIKKGQAVVRSKAYEFLYEIEEKELMNGVVDKFVYFLAQQKGKWGLIEPNENILIPFGYDYASRYIYNSHYESGFFMVKDNEAFVFDKESIPRDRPIWGESNKQALKSYPLAENPDALFFINDTGKVMIPPQYKEIRYYKQGPCTLVENAEKHQKIIIEETGEVIDKPWRYDIASIHPKSRIVLVKDTTEISYGVVRKDGKELIPCVNYGVAWGDVKTSTFFVKRDTPLIQRVRTRTYSEPISFKNDSLNIEDNDWLLYNAEGQLLNPQPFRFPFDFYKGIGIGVQGDVFNLYKADGTISSPQYQNQKTAIATGFNNIIRIQPYQYYALFRNQGLVPTMLLTRSDGQILVEEGRYDGISRFYDKYALVSAAGKIGLIDTLGREIIVPQDLRVSTIALIDSINLDKRFLHSYDERRDNEFINEYPVIINTAEFKLIADSLKISEQQRTDLLNLMLTEGLYDMIDNASNIKIERSLYIAKANFVRLYGGENNEYLYLKKLAVNEKYVSFVYENFGNSLGVSHNFQKINNRWEKRTLYDCIDLRGEKREQFNTLMTQKIKALKDVSIYCNDGDFLKQVEKRFILTEQGIEFCFESAEGFNQDIVIVSFTWAELKSFIR